MNSDSVSDTTTPTDNYDNEKRTQHRVSDGASTSPLAGERANSDELGKPKAKTRADGKIELQEADCYDKLGFSYPTWKKWAILSVIFAVQSSMNFNTSVYANAIDQLSTQFSITAQSARVGQMIFLIAYAFGSELWAPWSEELGRWPVLQLSLFLVNSEYSGRCHV